MKKTILLLFMILISAIGCAINGTTDTAVTTSLPAVPDKNEIKNFDNVPLNTITTAKETEYEFYNPKGGGFDELAAFGHNQVLFRRDNDKKEKTEPQLFLYDIANNKSEYIDVYNFYDYGALNSMYMNGRYYIYVTGNRKENIDTTIYITDIKEKTTSVLADLPGFFPVFSQYGENELVYFYYYEKDNKYYQYINLYNVETKNTKVLLENVSGIGSPEIYGMDVYDRDIYVLYHEITNGNLNTYINIYDINGNTVKSISNIDLGIKDKETVNDYYITASNLYVYENNIFIQTESMYGKFLFEFQYDGYKLNQIYGWDTGNENLYKNSEFVRNETFVSAAKDNEFIYFKSFDNNGNELLMLFDLKEKKATRFNFDIGGFCDLSDIVADDEGNLFFSLRGGETVKYYCLSFERIKALAGDSLIQ